MTAKQSDVLQPKQQKIDSKFYLFSSSLINNGAPASLALQTLQTFSEKEKEVSQVVHNWSLEMDT